MSETAAALGLQAKTDFVVDAHSDNWRRRIGCHHNLQTISQRCTFDCDLELLHALPPTAFALSLFRTELFCSSARTRSGSSSRTRAASRFNAEYASENSAGN